MDNLKQKAVKGMAWTLFEKISIQLVGFVVGMVLARLLTPSDYGTVALTGIFFAVAGSLVDSGFGLALIQKKDADDLDYNSVFYLNFFLSILAYVAFFFCAPFIAKFYNKPELTLLVRISSICFLYNAINAIQGAWLTKNMLFYLNFRISLATSIVSGVSGISLALMGYGVWSLVWASAITGVVGVVLRWIVIGWRPKLMFSFSRLKPLWGVGWKMAASGLLESAFNNLDSMVIGKYYSPTDLAYVNKGTSLPSLAINTIEMTIGNVSMPALVQLQDDKPRLVSAMRKMIQCSTFLVFPFLVLIAICSKSELLLLYGEQWVPAAPYMMLMCFAFALTPFHTLNTRAFVVLGRTDIYLKLSILKRILKLLAIVFSLRFGVLAFVVVSAVVLGPVGVVINTWPNKKLLGYSLRMQVADVIPTVGICAVMAAVVLGVDIAFSALGFGYDTTGSNWSLAAVLALQSILGLAVYFMLSYVFHARPMGEYARIAAPMLDRLSAKLSSRVLRRFSV